MKTDLQVIAEKMNEKLVLAGRDERWELDTDESSNSNGSWFCGSLGGVESARSMRGETRRLIETPALSRMDCPWFNPALQTSDR